MMTSNQMPRNLRKLWALFKMFTGIVLEYRAEGLTWVLINAIRPVSFIFVWLAIFRAQGKSSPDADAQIISYFLLVIMMTQAIRTHLSWPISRRIRKGVIGFQLVQPVNYVVRCIAEMLPFALRDVVIIGLAIVAIRVARPDLVMLPSSLVGVGGFLVAALFAMILSFLIELIFGFLTFWILDIKSVLLFGGALFSTLSGSIFPLFFLPETVKAIISVLPFRYMVSFPLELYLGILEAREAALGFVVATVWVVLLGGVGYVLWKRGVRRYAAYGG